MTRFDENDPGAKQVRDLLEVASNVMRDHLLDVTVPQLDIMARDEAASKDSLRAILSFCKSAVNHVKRGADATDPRTQDYLDALKRVGDVASMRLWDDEPDFDVESILDTVREMIERARGDMEHDD